MELYKVLPSRFLEKMDKKDRPKGKAGWTAKECHEAAEAKSEKQLQQQIVSMLNRKGIVWIGRARMDRKSSYTLGFPDLTIPLPGGVTFYWELKIPGGKLRPEQDQCLKSLALMGHRARVISSYAEAVYELRNVLA